MSLENNNNNDRNKKEKKSLYQIMDKQGFYIILILCVAIIAATAIWVNNQKEDYFIGEGPTNPFEEDMQPEVTLVEDNEAVEETDDAQETGKIGQGKPVEEDEKSSDTPKNQVKQDGKDNKEDIQKDSDKEEKLEETAVPEASEEASASVSMIVPVVGKLTLPFADDHLVYHKTLDQWSTHKGIDIQATEGSPVKAALDGEIVEVINDTIMGITITIKHNDDMLTRYSNLSTDAMVKVGDQVEKGQTISGVGKTASNKTLEGPVLHFQVLKDDKFIDPQIYLGKLNK
ncbi:M23 family metallopeptidase [Alkaliphilus sp. MSJ-5]|uniref:M23 family metallopeptidase n=1 Tax=Alkaliphilus flagellatus TaxID=2841507 RepID=A0ABS6G5F9_9FIRM|nr:M23 family metallopeptidase [Alkaliphilus flagellatus]MBU5676606.1 M23 family metallopeptidase [Alkaliphilus flagellatus]